jgi:hypothetical protein
MLGMEWITSSLAWNTTVASETFSSLATAANESVHSCLNFALDSALFSTEQLIKYTVNGDYPELQQLTAEKVNTVLDWLDLSPFQVKLLREFSLILLGNSLLVLLAWKIYGNRIKNKFMNSQTRKSVEELRTSFSELKLPQEMDFKFK